MGIWTALLLLALVFVVAYYAPKVSARIDKFLEPRPLTEEEIAAREFWSWCQEFDPDEKMSKAQRLWFYRHRND